MHCVPHGALKVIWQHFGAIHTHTHRCRAHTHWEKHTHSYPHQSMCAQRHTCAYSHVRKDWNHASTHSILSVFFLPCSLFSFSHPSYFLFSEYKSAAKSPWLKEGGPEANIWWTKRGGGKELLNISLSTYNEHLRSESLWFDGGEPSVWKSTSVSVITHQASEEELLHQRALWEAEYFMLHLVKTQLHFCSDLPWQCGITVIVKREGRGVWRPLLCSLRNSQMGRKEA